jgi:hypothetical protein
LFGVPSVLNSANTWSCSTSRRALVTARCGSYASSSVMNSIVRPPTPPFAFSALKRAWAPSAMLA